MHRRNKGYDHSYSYGSNKGVNPMKKCSRCKNTMKELKAKTPEGFGYTYFACTHCHEEILDMQQLHALAQQYRAMKNYHAKIAKWGTSLGMRIPKALVKKYNLKDTKEVMLIPEKEGIKIIPS